MTKRDRIVVTVTTFIVIVILALTAAFVLPDLLRRQTAPAKVATKIVPGRVTCYSGGVVIFHEENVLGFNPYRNDHRWEFVTKAGHVHVTGDCVLRRW